MTVAPHPDYKAIHGALARSLSAAAPFRGLLYRACDPTYANTRDLLSGEGSRITGGRWNAPASFATVYLAASLEGAVVETLGVAARHGFNPESRLPLTLVAVDARLGAVCDLTSRRFRRAIDITIAAMNSCDWRKENAGGQEALTQVLGRAAFELGAEAIIVPSATRRTLRNVNIFPGNLAAASHIAIRRAEKLPPPPPRETL